MSAITRQLISNGTAAANDERPRHGNRMNNSANSSHVLFQAVRILPYTIVGGFALGYAADRYFHAMPWRTLAVGMIRTFGALSHLVRIGKSSN